MNINWADLGEVLVASLMATVGGVALFAVGVLGLSRQATVREQGGSGAPNLAGAVICFTLCAVIVGFGIYLIIRH